MLEERWRAAGGIDVNDREGVIEESRSIESLRDLLGTQCPIEHIGPGLIHRHRRWSLAFCLSVSAMSVHMRRRSESTDLSI